MGYCDDCRNTLCICDIETKNSYPYRMKIKELEAKASILVGALESISKDYDRPSDMMKKAREALKKIGEV